MHQAISTAPRSAAGADESACAAERLQGGDAVVAEVELLQRCARPQALGGLQPVALQGQPPQLRQPAQHMRPVWLQEEPQPAIGLIDWPNLSGGTCRRLRGCGAGGTLPEHADLERCCTAGIRFRPSQSSRRFRRPAAGSALRSRLQPSSSWVSCVRCCMPSACHSAQQPRDCIVSREATILTGRTSRSGLIAFWKCNTSVSRTAGLTDAILLLAANSALKLAPFNDVSGASLLISLYDTSSRWRANNALRSGMVLRRLSCSMSSVKMGAETSCPTFDASSIKFCRREIARRSALQH